jgi:hypothetical protein
MSEIDDIESLEDLKLEITNRILEWKKNPIPKVYDDHFKLHPNSVQFGLDIALNLVTATIEELQNRNDELNEDGTYGYE